MALHKTECNGSLNFRHQYLGAINRAYDEHFSTMDEYKQEANFKRLLGKLTLADVWTAVERAERIMKKNKETGYHCSSTADMSFIKSTLRSPFGRLSSKSWMNARFPVIWNRE